MNTLTVVQILELIRINEAAIVTQFQTWLTITFATIVAVFSAKELLTFKMKWLITTLYLCASITLASIAVYLAENNVISIALLKSRGVEFASPLFAGVSLFCVVIIGMITTCYFIHSQFKASEKMFK